MLAIGSSALSFAAGVSAGAPAANMNGAFLVATGSSKQGGDPVVSFPDSYASKGHEYFDVWAPEIATHYGENFWTSQGNQPIPDHIIERFKGKTMAITGYEQDQVMVTPTGKPGVNPEKDVSVPINWAYNHHYMAWMTGRHSEMKYLAHPDPTDTSYHGGPAHWVAVDKPSAALRSDTSIPTSQMFSEGNGGESRKSFHGYPKGYAQLIDSPEEWHITPMQIDTRNRDCGVTPADVHRCVAFTPSLEPKQARYGRKVGASNYSGVLECPCNSRFGGDPIFYPSAQTKKVAHLYDVLGSGACAAGRAIASPEACYAAAVGLGLDPSALTNATAADPTRPAACYFVARPGGKVAVTFNTGGKAACAPGTLRTGVTAAPIGVTFNLTLDSAPAGGLATLTLTGPADAWFAAGIGASVMANAPYTVVANSSGVFERQIGTCGSEAEHCAGDDLPSSLTLVSNTVVGGKRTVVATRPFKGKSAKHHTFDPTKDAALPFITAYGTSQAFGYHKDHMATSLVLLAPEGEATCVCDGGTEGSLCGYNGTGCSRLAKSCRSPWDGVAGHSGGDLLAQRNPTCNGAQYSGGLSCCGHRRIMLDEDQDPGTTLLRCKSLPCYPATLLPCYQDPGTTLLRCKSRPRLGPLASRPLAQASDSRSPLVASQTT